jgi:hypothetical protein
VNTFGWSAEPVSSLKGFFTWVQYHRNI